MDGLARGCGMVVITHRRFKWRPFIMLKLLFAIAKELRIYNLLMIRPESTVSSCQTLGLNAE